MTVRSPEGAYSLELDVLSEHIDQLNHVNNVVYLNWVQDVAIRHWTLIAPESMQRSMFWVVARHELDYLRPLFLGDVAVVSTWIGAEDQGLFARHTRVARKSDDATALEALTWWCPMSMTDGRRIRDIPEEVRTLFSTVSGS